MQSIIAAILTLALVSASGAKDALLDRMDGSGWYEFTMPMNAARPGPCCWKHDRGDVWIGCGLEGEHDSAHFVQQEPEPAHVARVFAHVDGNGVIGVRVFGLNCPIDVGTAEPMVLVDVEGQQSFIFLLDQVANSRNDVRSGALLGLAFHADTRVETALATLIRSANSRGLSQQAVFWLGEARGTAGFEQLTGLLHELPTGPTRRHINMALAQSDAPGALALLERTARTDGDEEQRADALFWLAQRRGDEALDTIVESLRVDHSPAVRQRAIVALAQIESGAAADQLESIATDHPQPSERGDALFWLAQKHPKRAGDALLAAVESADDVIVERAIFALSQLPPGQSTPMLLGIVRGDYRRDVRKKALFWLAQSDDPAAIDALVGVLTD